MSCRETQAENFGSSNKTSHMEEKTFFIFKFFIFFLPKKAKNSPLVYSNKHHLNLQRSEPTRGLFNLRCSGSGLRDSVEQRLSKWEGRQKVGEKRKNMQKNPNMEPRKCVNFVIIHFIFCLSVMFSLASFLCVEIRKKKNLQENVTADISPSRSFIQPLGALSLNCRL